MDCGGLLYGVGQLLLSSSFVDRLTVAAGFLFIIAAAALFASDALDELTSTKCDSDPDDWGAVSAPEQRVAQATPVAESKEKILRRRFWGTLGGGLAMGTTVTAWIAFLGGILWLFSIPSGMQVGGDGISGVASVVAYFLVLAIIFICILGAYLLLFAVPFLTALPIALPLAFTWKQPARFLVLRPFNRGNASSALRRILRREIAPLGHCYTLADADIRVPLWLRLPVLLGQLSFFLFRRRKIIAPKDISKLVGAMGRRRLRNFNWCVSQSKVFPVACVDAGWRACVSRLVAECDCVVMDLSGMSQNIMWELELLKRQQAFGRTVFLVEESQAAAVQAARDCLLGSESTTPQIHAYRMRGKFDDYFLTSAAVNALRSDTMVKHV